ncbi:hypothetical protein D9M73_240890 [compost metagenome]
MPGQVRGQAETAERKFLLAHFHIDVHGDGHGRFTLFGLVADDDRIFRQLDRRRRQLTNGDRPLGYQHLAPDRQLFVLDRYFQVRCHLKLGIGFDRDRKARAS